MHKPVPVLVGALSVFRDTGLAVTLEVVAVLKFWDGIVTVALGVTLLESRVGEVAVALGVALFESRDDGVAVARAVYALMVASGIDALFKSWFKFTPRSFDKSAHKKTCWTLQYVYITHHT